jgi:hypothetical protein
MEALMVLWERFERTGSLLGWPAPRRPERDSLNSLIIAGAHPARLGLVYEPVRLLAPRGNGLREAQRQ